MSKRARSARGEVVDFDLLAIKEQLSTTPVPVGVQQRRKFIDEKDGIKTREVVVEPVQEVVATATTTEELPSALMVAAAAAEESAKASQTTQFRTKSSKSVVGSE